MPNISWALFVLYVRDQETSAAFYRTALAVEPVLHVPGMTEFAIGNSARLGLMPSDRIKRLLGDSLPHPDQSHGIPRAEVYLSVDNPQSYLDRALQAGATLLSPVQPRDWGDTVGYCLDPDSHVVAFARRS